MSATNTSEIHQNAISILRLNDKGTYTVPTHGLYPFQWNWDSCLTALGQSHFDENRAWREIETLFEHQWPDGMVPHIIFHELDDGYFPGPDVWQTDRPVATSGITQPPVAGFAVKRLYERASDREAARTRALALLPAIDRWHQWFFECRDPADEGLVALIHPWESGRDNSIDWDAPFQRVPTDGIQPYHRRDTDHADPAHRPTKEQYDRYLWLLQHFRGLQWNNHALHDESPFQVVDPGFNAILARSCHDVATLARELGLVEIADKNQARAEATVAALENLWSDDYSQYLCYDRIAGVHQQSASVAGLLAVFAPIPTARIDSIVAKLNTMAENSRFLVASHDPLDNRFDGKRYWRGPVWLIVNYMIIDGLKVAGQLDMAKRIETDSLKLIGESGFAEYYDPKSGEGCGGESFTWTAAMMLEFLKD